MELLVEQPVSPAPIPAPALREVAWPAARLGEALELLAWRSGLATRLTAPPPAAAVGEADLHALAAQLGVEVEPVAARYSALEALVRGAAPCILRLPLDGAGEPAFLAVLRCGRRALLITPELHLRRVAPALLCDALRAPFDGAHRPDVDQLLALAGVPSTRHPKARRLLIAESLGQSVIEAGWMLRPAPAASVWRSARDLKLGRALGLSVVLLLAVQGLAFAGWWALGHDAFDGSLNWFWLQLWALLLLTAVPLQLGHGLAQASFETRVSVLLRQRLLQGALALDPDAVRGQGIGHVLGHVAEVDTFDENVSGAILGALSASVQLLAAAAALAYGAVAGLHLSLLAGALAALAGLVALQLRAAGASLRAERALTNDLVERIAGHRTRLIQEPVEARHREEDRLLSHAVRIAGRTDILGALLASLPRLWLLAALAALVPSLLGGLSQQAALSLAGVLLALQALGSLAAGAPALIGATVAFAQIRPLLTVAGRDTAPPTTLSSPHASDAQPMLLMRGVTFHYGSGAEPALRHCDLQIHSGERILLEGSSGSGKSTLAAVVAGLRAPDSGLLLLHGLDRASLGAAEWRRHVAAAPQFHENHIFSATLAFNLLMGRRWPPTPDDLDAAAHLCRQLGLGPLLDRMPSGIQQVVGETGWALSHGERSRVFLARALLQGASLVLLDESFGALDPETLGEALDCALDHAPTLLAIVHT